MPSLVEPVAVGSSTAPSRVVFGPHETNLGRGRALSDRHVAYYQARAAGGAGLVVTETASVHRSDWPYERAPLAEVCGPGWSAVAGACRPHGTLVLAGLGHSGSQGSSANSQSVMWAPSPVADVISREMPVAMEPSDIDELVMAFGNAAATGQGVRARRRRDRCRVLFAPPPIPLRAHQPAVRPLRIRSPGPDHLGARGRTGWARTRRPAVHPAVLRRARPLGRGDSRTRRPPGGRPRRPGRPGRGGPGRPVLDLRLPSRRPRPGRVQLRAVPGHAGGGGRPGRHRPAGQRRRPVDGPVGPGRRDRRPGGDDPGPDRRPPPGHPGAPGPAGPGPALHPVQPGLPRPGHPQSHRELRGGTPERVRDGRARGRGNRSRRTGGADRGRGRGRARVRPGAVGAGPPAADGGAVRPGRRGVADRLDRPRSPAPGPFGRMADRRVPRPGGRDRDRGRGLDRRPRHRPAATVSRWCWPPGRDGRRWPSPWTGRVR